MNDILKLYFTLRVKRLWRMIKELGFVAIPATLLLLFLSAYMISGLIASPIYYSVALYTLLLPGLHFVRGDAAFLYALFGVKQTQLLFTIEYALLSIPFLCFFLFRGELWATAILLLPLPMVYAIPSGGFSLRLPTFPCLTSGSYEYHRAGRLSIPLFLLLMAGGAIGAYIGNRNLVVVVSLIAATVMSMLLMREWHVEYLFHYKSALRFLWLKLLFALRNTCIIFLPFMVCLLLVDSRFGALYYLGASLLLFQVEMLCLLSGRANGGNDIISAFAFMVLNAIFFASLIVPLVMPFSIVTSVVLAYYAYSAIKKFK